MIRYVGVVWTGPDLSIQHDRRFPFIEMMSNFNGNSDVQNDNINDAQQLPTISTHSSHQPIKIKPLDQLLGAYKTTTSKLIHLAGLHEFKWQRSYHDHIIRAEEAYHAIICYIQTNPARWREDKFHKR